MYRVKFLFYAVSFFLIASFIPDNVAAADYRIDWLNVSNRIYADSRGKVSKLQFVVTDDQGNYILGTNGEFVDFNSVELFRVATPTDIPVNISAITFFPDYEYKNGSFESVSGGWNYNIMSVLYEFQAEILDPLVTGDYKLRLRCDDGQTYESTVTLNQLVTVPIISNKSYQILPDSDGNVYFSWDIPETLIQLSTIYDFSYRPAVAVYEGETLKALLYPSAPIQSNMLFVPSADVQWLAGKGGTITLSVSVRTTDSKNRSHSIPLVVDDLLTIVMKKKQVAVVPLY